MTLLLNDLHGQRDSLPRGGGSVAAALVKEFEVNMG